MFLAEPGKYGDSINGKNKFIANIPLELIKKLRKNVLSYELIVNDIQYDR